MAALFSMTMPRAADLFEDLRGSAVQTLCQGARHVGRHLHANDRPHGAVPVVEQVQHDFDVLIEGVGGCEFRRAEVMRRRPSEFRDHEVPPVRSSRCGKSAYGRAACCGGPVLGLLTSSDDTSSGNGHRRA